MTSDNATTPAATPAVQEPRVNDAEMRISARIAEQQPVQNYSVVDRFALDLRDARATIASQAEALAAMKAENERVVANMVAAQHAQATAEAALKAAREAMQKAVEAKRRYFASNSGLERGITHLDMMYAIDALAALTKGA